MGLARGHDIIDSLRVDCFGFSRGAAAARYLVHLLASKGGLLDRLGNLFQVIRCEIPFVGLFDTVAHFDAIFANDTEELHLDAIKDKRVERVVHLAAGDEHRYNFPLTNIASAGEKGREYFLPGAHSDVGGCYNDTGESAEKLTVFQIKGDSDELLSERCRVIRRELVNLGWYQEEQISIQRKSIPDPQWRAPYFWLYEVVVTRVLISNKYSYVPLHIMAKKANEKGTH